MIAGGLASFGVDVEPDCPPYLEGFRGVEEGMPPLLELLGELDITATFFTTGEVARRYPSMMREVVDAGHELACHGMTHGDFTRMSREEAREEIEQSARILRRYGEVKSFRAPYLRFPDRYVDLLVRGGFDVDSSHAKYKLAYHRSRLLGSGDVPGLSRIPASATSSAFRYPSIVRAPYLRSLAAPLVLFVHPWEFVDMTRAPIPLSCRFRTGDEALRCVRDVLGEQLARGRTFLPIRDVADATRDLAPVAVSDASAAA